MTLPAAVRAGPAPLTQAIVGHARAAYRNGRSFGSQTMAESEFPATLARGTRVRDADRAHCFISGTAGKDAAGRVLHPGDAGLDDLTHLLVYLRDPSDFPRVSAALRERFPALPTLIVQGAVCRPDWLIEVEGIAVARNADPALPRF